MIRSSCAFALMALVAASGSASAAIVTYSTPAAFNAATTAQATDTFNNLPLAVVPSPINRVVTPYAYTASATNGFFPAGTSGDVWLSTNTATNPITINNFTGGVFAIAGFFFASDIGGAFTAGSISVTVTDASGSVTQILSGTPTTGYVGFTSDTGILSLTVTAVQPTAGFVWPTVNDLTLGTLIPTPGAAALLGLGGLVASRRRRA